MGIGIIRALASSATIGAWAIWRDLYIVWAILLGVSQIWEAIKERIPLAQRYKSSAAFATTLETLFIDSQYDWEKIRREELAENEIISRERRLRRMKQDAKNKNFPNGFTPPARFLDRAQRETDEYFHIMYPGE
jgi:hypothetical protein